MRLGLALLLVTSMQCGIELKSELDLSALELETLLETHCVPRPYGGLDCFSTTLKIECTPRRVLNWWGEVKLDCRLR